MFADGQAECPHKKRKKKKERKRKSQLALNH